MALNNVNSDAFTWYESATYEQIKDYYTITSSKFGTRKTKHIKHANKME